jgi:C4-type Zn-finger protein
VRSGLVNEPEPEPEVAQPESADDRLSKIEGLVQRLVAAAEARGLRI